MEIRKKKSIIFERKNGNEHACLSYLYISYMHYGLNLNTNSLNNIMLQDQYGQYGILI